MSNKELNIIVKVTDQASKQLQAVSKDVESFANKNKAVFEKMAWYWAVATTWLLALWKTAVDQASKMQDLRQQFDTMLWSAEKWRDLFMEVQKQAATTPYDSQQLAKTSAQLLNANIEQEKLIETTRMLWDISLWSAEKLDWLAYTFWQINVQWKLTWDNLRELRNRAFDPLAEMARTSWKSMQYFADEMAAGRISADMVKDAMISATSEWWKFHDWMANASQTFSGVMSTVQDEIWKALAALWWFANGEVVKWWLLDMLTEKSKGAIEVLQKMSDRAAANPELATNIFLVTTAVAWLVTWLWFLWLALPIVSWWIHALMSPVTLVIWWLALLYLARETNFLWIQDITTQIVEFLMPYIEMFLEFIKGLRATYGEDIIKRVKDMRGYIKEIFSWAFTVIEWVLKLFTWIFTQDWDMFFQWLYLIWDWLLKAIWWLFKLFVDTIRTYWDIWSELFLWAINLFRDTVKRIFESAMDFVWNIVSTKIDNIVQSVKNAIENVKNIASSIWSWIWDIAVSAWNFISWARANGWPVSSGSTYLVGERWPELFVPSSSWSIVSNKNLWPSINLTFWNFNGAERSDAEYIARVVEQKVIGAYNNYFAWLA